VAGIGAGRFAVVWLSFSLDPANAGMRSRILTTVVNRDDTQ
jgi:hypothetical protein